MARRYKWSRIGSRLIYKIRHHRGHGIHSPFVFNLINNVIEEKCPYYCYQDIAHYLSLFSEKKLIPNKRYKLAFKLSNYFGVRTILEIGSGSGINTLFLTAPSKKTSCISIEKNEKKREFAQTIYDDYDRSITLLEELPKQPMNEVFDCIYINLDYYPDITEDYLDDLCNKQCHDKSFIVMTGIRRNKENNRLWKHLTQNQSRTALLDLFNIGIIFFDKQLYRWEYQISF